MRSFHLPRLTPVVSIIGMSATLVAVPIALDGTKMGTGVAGAFAQSPTMPAGAGTPTATGSGRLQGSAAMTGVMTGVTNPVASGGFGRASGTPAATGNVTPAFGRTPAPAISSNPTPALSTVGGAVTSTSVGVAVSTSAAGISAEGAGNAEVAGNAARAPGSVSTDGRSGPSASATVSLADDLGNARGIKDVEPGSPSAGNRNDRPAASDIDPDFVMVGDTAAAVDVPMTTPAPFAMVCRSSDQTGCKAPPMFIISDE